MRAVIYTRVSNDRFGDERSPERQEKACRAFLAAREWTLAAAFRDVDISAYKGADRAGYDQLLEAIDGRRCDVVCVWKLDRLVRRPRDFEMFWERCERAGVALVSVTEPIDTSSDLGLALVRVLVTFAGLESATKSVRLVAANREQALLGNPHRPTTKAYGYEKGWMKIVPQEAALIREAADRVLAGEGVASIVRDWTHRGFVSARGKVWTVHGLRELLTKPRLWGMREYRGEIVAKGNWPPILSPEQGAALMYLFADPSRRREPNDPRRSLLTGLLRCGKCGGRLVTRRSSRDAPNYCCAEWPRGCNGLGVRQAGVDTVVVEAVLADLEARQTRVPLAFASLSTSVAVDATIRHATALRQAARDYYVTKFIDRPTFLAVRDELDRTLHEEVTGGPPTPIPARFEALFAAPRKVWPTLSHLDRRAALGVVVDHVVVHSAPRNGGRFRPERVEVVFPGQRSVRTPFPDAGELRPTDQFSVPDVAKILDLHYRTVQKYLRTGAMHGRIVDRHWEVSGAEVARCRDLRNLAGVKRVRRHSVKFAQIVREYDAGIRSLDSAGRPVLAIDAVADPSADPVAPDGRLDVT